jgi:hypothetical protein
MLRGMGIWVVNSMFGSRSVRGQKMYDVIQSSVTDKHRRSLLDERCIVKEQLM